MKVDEQERICRELAAARNWTVDPTHVYKDNSLSAWKRGRKRPGWDAMLKAVEHGEIDAIVVYHGDRLLRQPWDLEHLLSLADQKGIRLASIMGDRDLDNAEHRYILRIEAAAACRESDTISRRVTVGYERLAREGRTRLGGRGGRAFGFKPDGMTVNEDDATMLREVAERILDGESVGAICRDLNARGFVTATEGAWDHGALKKLMLRPRLAGLLSRHGEIVGAAAWPAILDRQTWEMVCAVLTNKAGQFTYATNTRRYLLTGIAVCGTEGCGQPLAIRHNVRAGLTGYGCISPGCPRKVHRAVHHLDPYVEGAVIARLNDAEVRRRLMSPVEVDYTRELLALEARRERVIAAFADDDRNGPDAMRLAVGRINDQIDEVRARMQATRVSRVLDDMWGIDVAVWKALPLARQRTAVQSLVKVTVFPSGRRGPGFDPATVALDDVGAEASQ